LRLRGGFEDLVGLMGHLIMTVLEGSGVSTKTGRFSERIGRRVGGAPRGRAVERGLLVARAMNLATSNQAMGASAVDDLLAELTDRPRERCGDATRSRSKDVELISVMLGTGSATVRR
jgi:hypothetical protein